MAPSRADIEKLCAHLATSDQSPFFDRVSPDVVWDVMGKKSVAPSPSTDEIRGLADVQLRHAGTHPAAGHFTSLGTPSTVFTTAVPLSVLITSPESWKKGALGVINERLQHPLQLKIVNVVGGGADQEWATVELEANGVCNNGTCPILSSRSLRRLRGRVGSVAES